MKGMKRRHLISVLLIAAVLTSTTALAQLGGHNFRGDYGLNSGSQPAPGWYVSLLYFNYDTGTVRNRNGDRIGFDPDQPGSLTAQVISPLVWWVSGKKILGANYSFVIAPSFVNSRLAAPVFGLEREAGFDVSDLYIQPINLGWHTKRADFSAGVGLFAPIGKYEDGAQDNTGLGMWSFEAFAGTTVHLDEKKSWNLALTAFWETHSDKKDSDQRVGDILTLEGGLGKAFAQGAINLGLAYFGQWKLSQDDFGLAVPAGLDIGKHRVFGAGPEVTLPIVANKKLIALVTARYVFDFGAKSTTEGDTLVVALTFPLGGG